MAAAFLAGAAGQLAVYLALVSGSNDVRLAVGNGAVTILALLALAPTTASHHPRRLAWILLALGLTAAGLVVQRSGLAAGSSTTTTSATCSRPRRCGPSTAPACSFATGRTFRTQTSAPARAKKP